MDVNLAWKAFTRKLWPAAFLLGTALPAFIAAPIAASEDVVVLPLKVNAYMDAGQIVKGSRYNPSNEATTVPIENYFLSNIGISLVSQTVIREKLQLNIGVGGLFWYPFSNARSNPDSRRIQFGPGVSEASFKYGFTEDLSLKFGFFGYKYNPDARNLGEYLLRSQAYPGIVKNGGWSLLNSAAYQSMGAQMTWSTFGGAWTHDLLLFSEFEETPIFDMSPAYVSTLKLGKAVELGGGISFHHLIPIKPSEEAPRTPENTYVEFADMPGLPAIDTVLNGTRIRQHAVPAGSTLRGMENVVMNYYDSGFNRMSRVKDAGGRTHFILGADTLQVKVRDPLTYQGIKLMGRASLDFKPWLNLEENLGPGDLKVYAEVAVLGVEDQPFFYENLRHRMPVMMGLNLPTFKLLDILSLEAEFFPNPWQENRRNAFEKSWPIWYLPESTSPADIEDAAASNYSRDDWKWSVMGSKTLVRGLRLHIQAANDHLRLRDEFLQNAFLPLTNEPSHWYYLARLEWGL